MLTLPKDVDRQEFVKVYEEFSDKSKRGTYHGLGLRALYEPKFQIWNVGKVMEEQTSVQICTKVREAESVK